MTEAKWPVDKWLGATLPHSSLKGRDEIGLEFITEQRTDLLYFFTFHRI
jgi:hypothetical protein